MKRSNGTPDLSVNTKHTSRPSRHDLRDQVGRVSGHESKHSESGAKKEKPPSKDGAAQRAAGEVAGLKDYVCSLFLHGFLDIVGCALVESGYF